MPFVGHVGAGAQVVTAEGIKVVRGPPMPDLGTAGASSETAAPVPVQA